jgi:hypothetical protein
VLPAVMEEHLPFALEYHLRGPQAGPAPRHTYEDMVGLLPINDRGKPLGQDQDRLGCPTGTCLAGPLSARIDSDTLGLDGLARWRCTKAAHSGE